MSYEHGLDSQWLRRYGYLKCMDTLIGMLAHEHYFSLQTAQFGVLFTLSSEELATAVTGTQSARFPRVGVS
jgi:hypothetical protein